jgi:hypothetical protein
MGILPEGGSGFSTPKTCCDSPKISAIATSSPRFRNSFIRAFHGPSATRSVEDVGDGKISGDDFGDIDIKFI